MATVRIVLVAESTHVPAHADDPAPDFSMPFASVYPAYVNKAERKGRSQEDVDRIICWLTGYDDAACGGRSRRRPTLRRSLRRHRR
jgi:hypothetical protein